MRSTNELAIVDQSWFFSFVKAVEEFASLEPTGSACIDIFAKPDLQRAGWFDMRYFRNDSLESILEGLRDQFGAITLASRALLKKQTKPHNSEGKKSCVAEDICFRKRQELHFRY